MLIIEPRQKLVMIGDSITDAGRTRPAGEGLFEAIGKGYVALVDALLISTYPEHRIRVVNQGNSGDTVRDLKARWQQDVIAQKPDWLSIMIGINDVWRQHDSPRQIERQVLLDEYKATLEELVAQTRPSLKGLILMTPYMIETSKTDIMRSQMDLYGAAVKELAKKYNAIFVDTQAAFDAVLDHYHAAALAWDRIHPAAPGHMIIAKAFLNAIGYEW